MTTTTLPAAAPATAETQPEYACWATVPPHIRRAVALEYGWALVQREVMPDGSYCTFALPRLRATIDGVGHCPWGVALRLLGDGGLESPPPWVVARRLGLDTGPVYAFMLAVDTGRIAPDGLARALGVD